MKSRKRQTNGIVNQRYLWGMATDYHTKLMLSTTWDGRNVELRYWECDYPKEKLYCTSRGVLIPTQCLPALINNLVSVEADYKFAAIQTIKQMTNTKIDLFICTLRPIEGDIGCVEIEVSEIDSRGEYIRPGMPIIIPTNEIPTLVKALKTIAKPLKG